MASKQELIQGMNAVAERALSDARSLTEADWSRPLYENGWNVKQTYCHVASVASIVPRLIERAKSPPQPAQQQASADIDAWNARHVGMRQDRATGEILAEIASAYRDAAEVIESTPESVLAVRVPDRASGGDVALSDRLMSMVVRHNNAHLDDLKKALGK